MPSAEWCVDCNKVLKGKLSWFYGLCPDCRKTPERKAYIKNIKREKGD